MPAHDSNDATWYVLRYAEDFVARAGVFRDPSVPFDDPTAPYLEPTLLFDERRSVLELQVEAPLDAVDPPPGIAVGPDGTIWCVAGDGGLVTVACDGTRAPFVCEPGILAQPAGLALDRRGFLYVADPGAHRVVVFDTTDGTVRDVLGGGGSTGTLAAPIDVAVASSGLVFVADRDSGRVAVFSSSMRPRASFELAGAPGKSPRPIAVMVDASGNVLIADAWFPRLLNYTPDGTRLADVEPSSLVAHLAGGEIAHGTWTRAYGERMPLFLVGTCGPCATAADDGAARLAEVHRALRLLALHLGRRFTTSGFFISRALDGGRPDVPWHRIAVELNGEPPVGTAVFIESFTSDTNTPGSPVWDAPRTASGQPISFTTHPVQLVQSSRGRYLWLRMTLVSEHGNATPSVKAVRVWYPRVSWLELLPAAYRRDPDAAVFLDSFLALFEHVFTRIEDRYARFSRELNPDAAPRDVIDWLAALIDLAFDPSWPVERRRALVAEAMSLYRTRGTVAGIERYVEIYTGMRPTIVEAWLERPAQPAFLGRPGSILGCGLPILGGRRPTAAVPDDELWAAYAHRFTIHVYIDHRCDTEVMLRAVDRIVEVNKPAHTAHRLEAIFQDARIGLQSRVGLDLVLGGPPAAAGVIGVDAVLGARCASYVRPFDGLTIE